MITTFVVWIVFAIAVGIALAVGIKMFKSVASKAKAAGVDLSDGLQSSEMRIIAKLLKEEAEQSAELEAIATLKRVIDRVSERVSDSTAKKSPPSV